MQLLKTSLNYDVFDAIENLKELTVELTQSHRMTVEEVTDKRTNETEIDDKMNIGFIWTFLSR